MHRCNDRCDRCARCLYETRSVTRTAEQMSLTQPSVSHALRRSRKQFNDNLFNRSSGAGSDYRATNPFHLQATDLAEIGLLPPVLALITESALDTYRRMLPDPGVAWLRATILSALRDWKLGRL